MAEMSNGMSIPERIAEAKRLSEVLDAQIEAANMRRAAGAERDALIKEFRIDVVGKAQVYFTLGETLPIEFLQRVQEVSRGLYGMDAIKPDQLQKWAGDPEFTTRLAQSGEIGINCNVNGEVDLVRLPPGKDIPLTVKTSELAVAYAAYLLATGRNGLGHDRVRTSGNTLVCYDNGLQVHPTYGGRGRRTYYRAASAPLPPRGKRS